MRWTVASHPWGSRSTPSRFNCYRNWDMHSPYGPLGLYIQAFPPLYPTIIIQRVVVEGGGRGGGGQDHVSRKIDWWFHNSREIKSVFHVSRKKWHFLAQP